MLSNIANLADGSPSCRYGKLNSLHCSENPWLLKDLIRKEWKSDTLIMSDWFGCYSISESVNAGQMPGVNKFRTTHYMNCLVSARKITLNAIKQRARKTLELVQKAAKGAPDVCTHRSVHRSPANVCARSWMVTGLRGM